MWMTNGRRFHVKLA
jgi:hypothetical protein